MNDHTASPFLFVRLDQYERPTEPKAEVARSSLKAYLLDNRDDFQFITDLTIRGKSALSELKVKSALIPAVQQR